MKNEPVVASTFVVAAAMACSSPAAAHTAVAKFHIRFPEASIASSRSRQATFRPAATVRGVLNSNGSASADVTETAFAFSNTIDFRRPHRGAGATGAWRHPNGSRPGQEQPSSDLESAQQCAGGERRHPRKDLLDVVARGQSAFRESATTPCLTARPFIIAAGRASPPPLVRCSEALRPASDSDACRSPSQG